MKIPGLKWMIIGACVYRFASQSILTMFLVDKGESLGGIGFMSRMAGQVFSKRYDYGEG